MGQQPAGSVEVHPELEVEIEIPRGSFIKRGSDGRLDFISPLPCPFNYGSVRAYLGLEGDYLDAVVLGPRLKRGARVRVRAFEAVGLTDRGLYDDKLICALTAPGSKVRGRILRFFHLYARAKAVLNFMRGQSGRNHCDGWSGAQESLQRARPCEQDGAAEPRVRF